MANKVLDWDEMYPGRFFKAGILGNAKPVLTIASVELEDLEGDKGITRKGVLGFQGESLQLPLNKTNGICLREMFGRKPFEWVGKRFAIFASEWAGEPCIRIWGSPDLADDLEVTVQLPRKKPIKMTMHAMGTKTLKAVPADKPTLSPRVAELMKMMGAAGNGEALTDIEADIAMESFTEDETRILTKAIAKRRGQLGNT